MKNKFNMELFIAIIFGIAAVAVLVAMAVYSVKLWSAPEPEPEISMERRTVIKEAFIDGCVIEAPELEQFCECAYDELGGAESILELSSHSVSEEWGDDRFAEELLKRAPVCIAKHI